MTDHQDIIAAFVDNEPVAAEALAAALSTSSGRDYLIDLLVLRGLINGDGRIARTLQRTAEASAGSRRRGGRMNLWLAAALVTVCVSAGFMAGRLSWPGTTNSDRSPASATVTPIAPPAPGTNAPAPTHVIRLERGVDWNERSGGN